VKSIFTLFFALLPLASAQTADPALLANYREKVLSLRINHVIEYRAEALRRCAQHISVRQAPRIHELALALSLGLTSDSSRLMQLYQQTEDPWVQHRCSRELALQDNKLSAVERKKFATIKLFMQMSCGVNPLCYDLLPKILKEVDPHCAPASEVIPDFLTSELETNPCFAGDRLVGKALWDGNGSSLDRLHQFVIQFHAGVSQAADGATLELSNYSERSSPLALLAMLSFLSASSSSNSGYVDGFGDYIWQQSLKLGYTPEETLSGYHFYKRIKDLGRDLFAWSQKKHLKLMIGKRFDVSNANRHDFMAAFLACHYRSEDRAAVAKVVPIVLGIGYESLDFVSHIKQGVSVRASVENFNEDTARYRHAAEWATDFCRRPELD
jgi:hypothetical protein